MSTSTPSTLTAPSPLSTSSLRRHDLDSLRILAMLGVFLFHNARFFDPLPWHLKNPTPSTLALIFVGLLDRFQMPLLMLLSGAGAFFSLRSRNPGQYLLERIQRLLIPLYTVGLFLLIPPQYFWELRTNARFTGSFSQSLPLFFQTFSFAPDLRFLAFWPGHLWFLRDLFLICLLTLPLLLILKTAPARRLTSRLASLSDHPLAILLPAIPVIAAQLTLSAALSPNHPLINFTSLLTFFLLGFLTITDPHFTHSLQRRAFPCLAAAILTFAAMAAWVFVAGYQPWQARAFSPQYAAFISLAALNTWLWVAAFLGLAARFLNFTTPLLSHCNQAVLPFYILHQTIILSVGLFIIRTPLPIPAKYTTIALTSFAAILLLYELLIRRVPFLRFLFGMRPTRPLFPSPRYFSGERAG